MCAERGERAAAGESRLWMCYGELVNSDLFNIHEFQREDIKVEPLITFQFEQLHRKLRAFAPLDHHE